MLQIIQEANDFIWGFPLLIVLMGTHLYFTCKLHMPQRRIFHAIRLSLGMEDTGDNNLSPFSALATTLAATLGTGNIIGVSTAVALGGPGAVFWCWITGILGMATAYAECYLSVLFRSRRKDGTYVGGPMYVLRNGLHNKLLGAAYALCTLIAAFGAGCTTQANSAAQAVSQSFSLSPHLIGILLAAVTGTVILGGVKAIGNLCERIIPAIGFIYLLGCFLLLALYHEQVIDACLFILENAFSVSSVAGGFAGSAIQQSLRYGIARGLFTNEAGIGTSAIAAAASGTDDPKRQAYVSMTAVFWDTVVMCLVTGIVIVANMLYDPASVQGVPATGLTAAAFSHLPYVGDAFLTVSLTSFAVTTLIGWSYFGEKATEYLVGNKGIPYYKLLYILMIYLGAIIPMNLVWECTDLINGLMAIPNILALFLLRRYIRP
ncbi:MAG: amino acid carrier protein [Blautia sp.]|nr:amino acid carrier protein [Blautia sp.]MCM1199767.1 amino acid carrier protein [Bacteroides fragilis]